MSAEYRKEAAVAVISLSQPPVNALNLITRMELSEALRKANADPGISAIVLRGAGKAFCGGADISEFDSPVSMQEPNLLTLILEIEASAKPVVAAVHAVCMGGGLELALACHYRIVAPGTSVALPEVKLGLIPGAGGTQRLPRVLGVEPALNMILTGDVLKSEALMRIPGQSLFNSMSQSAETLEDEAVAFAGSLASDVGGVLPRVRDLACKHPQGDAYFQFARTTVAAKFKNYPAPLKCIDAVEAATKMRFDQGMAEELRMFGELMKSPQSQALRHLFKAERAATKIADVGADTASRSIGLVGVVGAGTMGIGIAMSFINAGVPVKILEMSEEALTRGLAAVKANYEAQVKKGSLSADRFQERLGLLTSTLNYDELRDCDLIVEAVYEHITAKEKVFKELDRVAKPGAILASNTSSLDLNKIAGFTSRPQDVVGLHFFSPANVMKLIEVIRGEKTATDVLATIMTLAKKIKKTAVVSGVCDGFIGNRMIEQYVRQAGFLLDEGATPQQVDAAAERFGFAMGPFRMLDLAGNDIGWAIRKRRAIDYPEMRYSATADTLCEMGRFGQKTGAGWYDYLPGKREAVPSRLVLDLLDTHRKNLNITPRKISDDEIVQRLVFALVNEGAHVLEDGIAQRSGDIDIVYVTGYGFPVWRGGPMQYANQLGLYNVAAAMRKFALNPLDDKAFWQPATLIERLIADNNKFS